MKPLALVETPADLIRPRVQLFDVVRGIAILLMVADHLLVVIDAANILRLGPTRLALPLFLVVAGVLFDPEAWPRKRDKQLLIAGLVAVPMSVAAGLDPMNPILTAVIGFAVLGAARQYWMWLLPIAIIQPFTWPLAIGGYEPGTTVALLIAGRFLASHLDNADSWRSSAWISTRLERIGRRPVAVYLGHLFILGLLALSMSIERG